MKALILSALIRRQELRQLVIKKEFQDGSGIFLSGGPQRLLEPDRIEGLFTADLFTRCV